MRLVIFVLLLGATAFSAPPVRWAASDSRCTHFWNKSVEYRQIAVNGIRVAVSLQEREGRFWSLVIAINDGRTPVDILPLGFEVQSIDPPGAVEKALAPEKLKAKLSLAERLARVGGGAAAGYSDACGRATKTGSATVRDSSGNRADVDIYTRDTSSKTDSMKQSYDARVSQLAARNEGLQSRLLLANTVEPAQDVMGYVAFPREKKKYHEVVVRVPIAGTTLEFPFIFTK